ncbi:acetyl-coenzyme A synthetase N-terminal domain-containing protein, partial [Pantoea sp. SIMBA_133]
MSDHQHVYPVSDAFAKTAWADKATYDKLYRQSVEDPEGFWKEQAARLDWIKPPQTIKSVS